MSFSIDDFYGVATYQPADEYPNSWRHRTSSQRCSVQGIGCLVALPSPASQVEAAREVVLSFALQNLIDSFLQRLLFAAFWGKGITSRAE